MNVSYSFGVRYIFSYSLTFIKSSNPELNQQLPQNDKPKEENMQVDSVSKEVDKNGYLCAFCHFIFSTKSGYMEHTKLGNCVQVSKLFF